MSPGSLDARLAALDRAAGLGDGRLDDATVAAARAVVARAGARLGLGVGTTVAALAGPTGAGKSTLFNALAGAELATAGVRRPTTARTSAAVWGAPEPALLDWLDVPSRHGLGGERDLVLLDLPDFDSIEAANRAEVDRVVGLADLLVWVTDPQKYADGALHEGYLRPLAGHRDVMAVVLNQADRVQPGALPALLEDLRRLLAADGLGGVPVLAVSAVTGDGLPALRALLDDRAAARSAAVDRLGADVGRAARDLAAGAGCDDDGRGAGGARRLLGRGDPVPEAARARLDVALADAAGVPVVVGAVARAHRRRGVLAAGWPVARWLGRLRPDPLKRLRLGEAPAPDVRTSIPRATAVQASGVGSALRSLAEDVAGGLPAPWPGLVRGAATRDEDALPDALDRAVAGTELPQRRPRWWALAGALQRLLALVALAGLLWLAGLAALGVLRLDEVVPTPEVEGVAVPTLLLAAGLLGGLALALVARWLTGIGAARRARRAQRSLHAAVHEVAEARVLAPVRDELAARGELCAALADARG